MQKDGKIIKNLGKLMETCWKNDGKMLEKS